MSHPSWDCTIFGARTIYQRKIHQYRYRFIFMNHKHHICIIYILDSRLLEFGSYDSRVHHRYSTLSARIATDAIVFLTLFY